LKANLQTRFVHHGKHARETIVFLTDEVTNRATVIAVGHHTSWTAVNAEFVLNRDGVGVVALAQATIIVNQELGDDKQGNAFATRGCIGEPSEHEVNDVLCRVVVTPGDVNLLPENLVVITVSLSARLHGT